MSASNGTVDRDDVAALASGTKAPYDALCNKGVLVAKAASQTDALCEHLQTLAERLVEDGGERGIIMGVSRPTYRGALLPLGTPARDVARDVQKHLREVPSLVFDAWLALHRYDWQSDRRASRFKEAVWRLADAHLILHLASAQADLTQLCLVVDHPLWHRIDTQFAAIESFAPGAVATARFVLQRAREKPSLESELLGRKRFLSRGSAKAFRAAGAYAGVVRELMAALQCAAARLLLDDDVKGAEADLAEVQPVSTALALAAGTDVSRCDPAAITRWLATCKAVLSRRRGVRV